MSCQLKQNIVAVSLFQCKELMLMSTVTLLGYSNPILFYGIIFFNGRLPVLEFTLLC